MNLKTLFLSLLCASAACFAIEPTVGVVAGNFLAVGTDRIPPLSAEAQWKVGEPVPQGAVTVRRYFNVAEGYANPLTVVHVDTQFKGKDLEKFLSSFLDASLKVWGGDHKLTNATLKIGGESFQVRRIEGLNAKKGLDAVFYCTSDGRTIVVALIGSTASISGYSSAFESGFSKDDSSASK